MNKFLRNVTVSILFGVLASVCFSDVVSAPVTMKDKLTEQQETLLKNKDIPEKAETAIVNKTSDQPLSVPDELRAAITEHVDPETGKKYQELHIKFAVKNIEHIRRTSVRRLFVVNGILVQEKVGGEENPAINYGYVSKPKDLQWENLIGLNVEMYCEIIKMKDKKYNANMYCHLASKTKEYFVKFY